MSIRITAEEARLRKMKEELLRKWQNPEKVKAYLMTQNYSEEAIDKEMSSTSYSNEEPQGVQQPEKTINVYGLSPQARAIVEGKDDYQTWYEGTTPTDRKEVKNELLKVGFDVTPKKKEVVEGEIASGSELIGDSNVKKIGQGKAAMELLNDLEKVIDDPEKSNVFAPIRGWIGKTNPYHTETQSVQAQIDATKQLVGKYLEEGVLRKEDELKYEKILPKVGDTQKVAKAKVEQVRKMILNKTQAELEVLGAAGYDVDEINEAMKVSQETPSLSEETTPPPQDQAGEGREVVNEQQAKDYEQARAWLEANPNDPNAEKVRAVLEAKPKQKATLANVKPATIIEPPDDGKKRPWWDSLSSKVGNFLGIKKFAEGLGVSVFLMTKEGRDLQDKADKGDKFALDALNEILAEAPTSKEVVGSAALTAANILAPGVAGKGGTLGQKVLVGAGTGGVFGAAGGLEQDKDAKGVVKSTLTSAAVGAVIPVVFAGASKAKDKIATLAKWSSKKTYDSALGLTGSKIEKGASPSKALIEKRVIGGQHKLQKVAQESRRNIDKEIEKHLNSEIKTKTSDVVDDIINKTSKDFRGNVDQSEIEKVLLSKKMPFKQLLEKEDLDMKDLNELRKVIDNKFIGNSKWNSQGPDAHTVAVLKNAANAARERVKASHPNLPALFDDYATAIKLDQAITSELVRPRRLRNYIDLAMGAGVGVVNPAAGAATFVAKKVGESTIGKTTAAVSLDRVANVLDKIKGDKAGMISRTLILNALRELKDEEEN